MAVGAVAGGVLGSRLGRNLDEADRREQELAAQQAFDETRAGQTVAWNNPDSGNSGSITPTKTYQNTGGEFCREFTQTVSIGGEEEEAFGTACRKPDGSWQVQS